MLKANELRRGNWVSDNYNTYIQVWEITEDRINMWGANHIHGSDFMYKVNDLNPILLTEDWLLKFGFDKLDRFFEMDDVILLKVGGSYLYYYNNHSDKRTDVKYVHQLQNLYFALTGQELTIKELANA